MSTYLEQMSHIYPTQNYKKDLRNAWNTQICVAGHGERCYVLRKLSIQDRNPFGSFPESHIGRLWLAKLQPHKANLDYSVQKGPTPERKDVWLS